MRTGTVLILLVLLLTLPGCARHRSQPAEAPITHVVLCWLKEPGNEQARRRIIEASHTFATIPGVRSVSAGTPLPETAARPIVDASCVVMGVMTFDSVEALQAYDSHPVHRNAVEQLLRPLADRIRVYDSISAKEKGTRTR